jgi:hypothetical protein
MYVLSQIKYYIIELKYICSIIIYEYALLK